MRRAEPLLVALSGRPGVGKSTIARALALESGGVWLRIDSFEQAIREAGRLLGDIGDAGYRAAYAVALDNLRLGRLVISDAVNDWGVSRDAWRDLALRAGAQLLEVEVVCSDPDEHRRRVEQRRSDIPGLVLPSWNATMKRDYHAWTRDHLVVDTAQRGVADCIAAITAAVATHR